MAIQLRKGQQDAEAVMAELPPLLGWCPQRGLPSPRLLFRLLTTFSGSQVPHHSLQTCVVYQTHFAHGELEQIAIEQGLKSRLDQILLHTLKGFLGSLGHLGYVLVTDVSAWHL